MVSSCSGILAAQLACLLLTALAQPCAEGDNACRQDMVEALLEEQTLGHLGLLQMPQRSAQSITCLGQKPPTTSCDEDGKCSYHCNSGGSPSTVCDAGDVIEMVTCDRDGCSWKCVDYEQKGIGCAGDMKLNSCDADGKCTYICHGASWTNGSALVCNTGEVFAQTGCGGGGCSFDCSRVVPCPKTPELSGCNRMTNPLSICVFSCPSDSDSAYLQCRNGAGPIQVEPSELLSQPSCEEGGCWKCAWEARAEYAPGNEQVPKRWFSGLGP